MMPDLRRITTSLSYSGVIRISITTLELLGYPKDLLLLINEKMHKIAYEPCSEKDKRKINIKYSDSTINNGRIINSYRFTKKVFQIEGWDTKYRYQIPGKYIEDKKVVVFNLKEAHPVKNNTYSDDEDEDLLYDINI